jgi:pseudo-rSAM protein
MKVMKMNDYWFFLKSHVYVEFKKAEILLYDTQNGNYLETVSEYVIALVSQLYDSKNLGVTLLNKELQKNSDIQNFVQEVLEKQMGNLLETETNPIKPVRLIPTLNLQRDIDKLKDKKEYFSLVGKDIINYLLEVDIYVNDVCNRTCLQCKKYCTQIHCCTANNTGKELTAEELENIFRQISYSSVGRVNILGGNIINEIGKIQESLMSFRGQFENVLHYYLYYENYEWNEFVELSKLELIVNFPINETLFKDVWSIVDKEKITVHFIIEEEEQYANAEELIDELGIEKYSINPFFTGKNLDFFKKNLFLGKEEIFSEILQMREIFRNKKLNSNFFGTLYILPDGTIKANINTKALGNIKTNTILEVLYKELIENTAWRKIRDSHPCNECLYQFLCPAPSDYEMAIGQLNLCNIITK